jgi:hypothetical protein
MKKLIAVLMTAALLLRIRMRKSAGGAHADRAALKGRPHWNFLPDERGYPLTIPGSSTTRPDTVVGKFVSGEIDVAAVCRSTWHSTLYNKTEGNVVVLCIDTLGVLYVVKTAIPSTRSATLPAKPLRASGKAAHRSSCWITCSRRTS